MSSLTYDICLLYLDDILVCSNTFKEHCDSLTAIFDRLEKFTQKPISMKCHLFQRNVTFLVHVVSVKGIGCNPDKVATIAMWPQPTNFLEV